MIARARTTIFCHCQHFLKYFLSAILIGSRACDTLIFSICQHFFKLFNPTDLLCFLCPSSSVGVELLTDRPHRRPRRPPQRPHNKNIFYTYTYTRRLPPRYTPRLPLNIPANDPLLRAITPWLYLRIAPYTARLPLERKKKPPSVTRWQNENLNELYCYYMPRTCPVAKLAYVPSSCKSYPAFIDTYFLVLYNGTSTCGKPKKIISFCLVL